MKNGDKAYQKVNGKPSYIGVVNQVLDNGKQILVLKSSGDYYLADSKDVFTFNELEVQQKEFITRILKEAIDLISNSGFDFEDTKDKIIAGLTVIKKVGNKWN